MAFSHLFFGWPDSSILLAQFTNLRCKTRAHCDGHWTKATQIGGRIIAFGKCFSKNEMKLKLPLLTLTNRRSFLSCLCNFIAQLKTYARARVLVSETLPPAIASHRNDVGETKKPEEVRNDNGLAVLVVTPARRRSNC